MRGRPLAAPVGSQGAEPGEPRGVARAPSANARAAAALMSEAQRVANFGSWEWWVLEDRVTWSDQLFRIFGLDPSTFEPTLAGYLKQVHPDDRARILREIEAGVKDRRPYSFEHRLADEGTERVVRCMGEPIADPDSGEVVRVVGVCQDVSDLVRSERARATADARFRTAFENAPNGIALVDFADGPEGRLTAVNRALAELSGRTEAELTGSTLANLGEEPDLDLALRERLAAGEIDRFSIEKRARFGDRVAWLNLSVSALPGARGRRECIVQIEDISERKRFEERLRYMADHDSLTGLMNRRRFRDALESRLALQRRYGGEDALLVIDVDGLKKINDARGHATGDAVLRCVADVMRGRVRSTDVVARLAGDEFAVLLPSATPEQSAALAADLVARMAAEEVEGVRPSVSVGIARLGAEAAGAEEVTATADAAMYRAKQRGGGVFEPGSEAADAPGSPREAESDRFGLAVTGSLAEQVRAALHAGDLILYAQPAIDLQSGQIAHREVLVRMREGAGSVIPASEFLAAAAQEPGLCAEIDRWVVERALASLGNGLRGTRLHVNLSGETLNDGPSLSRFVRALRGAPEHSHWLGLEIEEAAIRRNAVAASAAVRQLAATGCPLVLDGFTGTAGSFEHLQRLPLDQVKLDGLLTRELMQEGADAATLRAVVRVAQGTGKTTVAKLVESEALVPVLRTHGVDMAQGYELGSPSPLGD